MHILRTITFTGELRPVTSMEWCDFQARCVLLSLIINPKVKYIYRRVPYKTTKGPGYIRLFDGDQIVFGGGPEAARLGLGPNPSLCNLQLAVARVIRMSGAAEVIQQIVDDGDDSDFPHVFIASPAFCNILTAQLQLAGGVLP